MINFMDEIKTIEVLSNFGNIHLEFDRQREIVNYT